MLAKRATKENLLVIVISIIAISIFLLNLYLHNKNTFFKLHDDAYYYYIVAKNLASHGVSTFDGQNLTNGYHPLWLLVVAALIFFFNITPNGIVLTEIVLIFFGMYLFLKCFKSRHFLPHVLLSVSIATTLVPMLAHGMETSLFFFSYALFSYLLIRYHLSEENSPSVFFITIALIVCSFSRIEAIAFVFPSALIIFKSTKERRILILSLAAAIFSYLAINYLVFSTPLPVSGSVKSIGGFQLNSKLLNPLLSWNGSVYYLIWKLISSKFYSQLISLLASFSIFLLFQRKNNLLLGLHVALGFGFVAYWIKLFFFSSWKIWVWYNFPLIPIVFLLALTIDFALSSRKWEFNSSYSFLKLGSSLVMIGLSLFGALCTIHWYRSSTIETFKDFEKLNKVVAEKLSSQLNGARIAMGDRAGSFAYYYKGSVVQLEGLVNDAKYLKSLKRNKYMNKDLCDNGVTYVASYQPDLGEYKDIEIPVIRPYLSQFVAPKIRLSKSDEIGRFFDLNIYDNRLWEEGDSYIYIWKLTDGKIYKKGKRSIAAISP